MKDANFFKIISSSLIKNYIYHKEKKREEKKVQENDRERKEKGDGGRRIIPIWNILIVNWLTCMSVLQCELWISEYHYLVEYGKENIIIIKLQIK